MVNRHRGEIEAVLDGKSYRLCLTLGALAELEHAFGEDDMLAVAERFEAGRIAARDAIRMIGAGLARIDPSILAPWLQVATLSVGLVTGIGSFGLVFLKYVQRWRETKP
jgi:hypothetical protein